MGNTKLTRYRTAGGNIVTYTPNPNHDPNIWGSWTCGGCHDSRSGRVVAPDGESHAKSCNAL